jgi:hypothetical protein
MGKYINQDSRSLPLGSSFDQKVMSLIADGATRIPSDKFVPNMVCVVDNGHFAAAGYCYSEGEHAAFNHPTDGRRKTWLQYEHAEKLAN